jgi:predicted transcriptional regulator
MGRVMGGRGGAPQQGDLFGAVSSGVVAEPLLMALHAEYYDLIWQGLKTHEFRRRFPAGRSARWFVYLSAPVSRLAAVIDLGPAVVDVPERIAAIAERAREGNGASVLEYVQDLPQAFAIPILSVSEYAGLSADELRAELGRFHPPQGYVRLSQHPELLAVCEKLAAGVPSRKMMVHHR